MNNKQQNGHSPAAPSIGLSDVYYVLFRHKWKIIILSALGLVGALAVYIEKPVTYQSEADLAIKYIQENNAPVLSAADGHVMAVDTSGDAIINTEIALLSSFDIVQQVATNIGASNILAKAGGGNDPIVAANYMRKNLEIERMPKSPVLRITYSHPDSGLVKPILKSIIDTYVTRHTSFHGSIGANYDQLVEQTDNLHKDLLKTEEDLRKKKADADVIDLDEAMKNNNAQIETVNAEISKTSDDLALHQGLLRQLKSKDPTYAASATNGLSVTNTVGATNAGVLASTNVEVAVPQETIDEYNQTIDLIASYVKEYNDLRKTYPAHNKLVLEADDKIKEAKKHKKQLEQDEPRLPKLKLATSGSGPDTSGTPAVDPIANEEAQIAVLQLKLNIQQQRMAQIQATVTNLQAKSAEIVDLERDEKLREQNYLKYKSNLQGVRNDIDIGAAKNANIQLTQEPTPPGLALGKTPKVMAIVALAGILGGIGWAFITEFYLDRSVRRPKEVETDLGMRLFLSIPDLNRNGHRKLLKGRQLKAPEKEETEEGSKNGGSDSAAHGGNGSNGTNETNGAHGSLEVAPWDSNHAMYEYYEALRDRLISYFESNNLTHKPKLVAVTGSGRGTGTTTIASGLAASLSETGDGNVLLIDMNIEQGGAQQFYRGKPNRELNEALANDTRGATMVQKNLYVVSGSTNGDQLARMLPKRFANLLPTLKASDYDYIIFDMPPIARTGVTQRLASFMDMMLLVVEAEKTSRDVVRQAGSLIAESKANVSVVLNKTRTYIPEKLHQEF